MLQVHSAEKASGSRPAERAFLVGNYWQHVRQITFPEKRPELRQPDSILAAFVTHARQSQQRVQQQQVVCCVSNNISQA